MTFTEAERGDEYIKASSPKKSPLTIFLTLALLISIST